MTSNLDPKEILNQIAQIQHMVRGKLCVLRHGPRGPYFNCQCWEKGKNRSRYVPADQLAAYQEGIEGYQRFVQLSEHYAQQIITRTHAELAAGKKKQKMSRSRSASPKSKKSSN